MNDDTVQCSIAVPELELGTVPGMLTRYGALIVDVSLADHIYSLRAEIPRGALLDFRSWLSSAVRGSTFMEV